MGIWGDPTLRVTKAVADFCFLHRSLRLKFINGKPKKVVEHLVSVIRPVTLNAMIESELEMEKSDLKKDFLKFVANLEKMDIKHHDHCHVIDHKETGDSGTKNTGKCREVGGRSFGHNSVGSTSRGGTNKTSDRDRTKFGN
jgi:hypothetical protein